jgi:UDP-N-acetylglucosamine 1-carboxyvinyltransferase
MDKIVITGDQKLNGEIFVSGSKNSSLPIIIGTLLTDDDVILRNVPRLRDINTVIKLLQHLGKNVSWDNDKLIIKHNGVKRTDAPYELVKQMRASALVMGPLLGRYGEVKVSLPGGCAIGARPINIHLDNLALMDSDIEVAEGYVNATTKKLKGAKLFLAYPSVGATENLMMAASLAKGQTIIQNAAREPEINDLENFLNKMGADIKGAGTSEIIINGVSSLQGCEHTVIPDRIEAGTFIIALAITKGSGIVKNVVPEHIDALMTKLVEAGVDLEVRNKNEIIVKTKEKIKPVDIETLPYPGFPTDMQAQWMALMCAADGNSVISETVFENRFMHVAELQRMGAHLKIKGHTVFVEGNQVLSGAQVMATDLRASAALILAGLAAKGKTEITRVYHLDRGYEFIEKKLQKLGAHIERVKDE